MKPYSNAVPLYPPYVGHYPLNPNILRSNVAPQSNSYNPSPLRASTLSFNPSLCFNKWGFLSPALLGASAAFLLSLFADNQELGECSNGTFFKLLILGYSIGATVTTSYYVYKVLTSSLDCSNHYLHAVGGALISIILLFAANYLLLFRLFPSSFKGEIGDDFCTQFLSFLYLSITSIATADLGDILPANTTTRLLIATEIAYNLFTLVVGVPLLISQKSS